MGIGETGVGEMGVGETGTPQTKYIFFNSQMKPKEQWSCKRSPDILA